MTTFWIAVALLSLVVSLLLVWPIWKRKVEKPVLEQDQLNVAIFEDRMKELDAELAEGVLTRERYEQAKHELQRDLLQNIGGERSTAVLKKGDGGRWVAPLVAVLVPAMAVYTYLQVGSPELIDKPPMTAQAPRHQAGGGAEQMAGDMETMVRRLQERLQENPQDVDGWVLLGRSMVMLRRYQEAANAYAKAYELVGDVPEIMAQYAETLALSQGGRFEGRSVELLERAREVDPKAPRVLWLLGVVAAQRGEPEKAIETWNQLLALLPPEGEVTQMVKASIAQLGGRSSANGSTGAIGGQQDQKGSAAGKIELRVEIAPELRDKVSPEDVVFIFARPVQGPRMPLAAVRHRVKELPLAITLDDSMSMAGKKLSSYGEVVVVARVSKSASPMPQSGDLEGSTVAKTGQDGEVSLIIDTIRP